MRADSSPGDPAGATLIEKEAAHVVPVDAEFVLVMACGNVRVAARLHVRIDAQRGRGSMSKVCGLLGQHLELGFGFDVEDQNASAERFANFFPRFSHA